MTADLPERGGGGGIEGFEPEKDLNAAGGVHPVQQIAIAPAYDATLSRMVPGGALVQPTTVGELRAADDGFVRLFVDSSRLEPGLYSLVLSASGEETKQIPTSSFRMKVIGAEVNLNPSQ